MAPLKFEEHIKDKLEQRKLQPSADAWQKLSEKLDEDNSKKSHKGFWWLGIAASLVGVLLVTTFLTNSNTEKTVTPIIVDANEGEAIIKNEVITDVNIENTNDEEQVNTTEDDKVNKENTTSNSIKPKPIQKSILKQKIEKEKVKLIPEKVDEAVAENSVKTFSKEENAIQTVVAEMQKLNDQNTSSIDSELDALLSEAQKEIALEKLYKKAIETVDAEALLQGAEQDLDISFRNKVFEALKDSYKTVKSAVAQRNN